LETDDNRDNEGIAMITKLVSNDNNNKNSFKLPLYYISWENKIYDNINKTGKRKTNSFLKVRLQ
jgi:hypothetical protein